MSETTQTPEAAADRVLLDRLVRPLPEETYETGEGPSCPFCGTQWTADDPVYFDEYGFEEACSECGNVIRIEPEISVSWTTKPIRWANSGIRCHSDERINRQHIQTNTDK